MHQGVMRSYYVYVPEQVEGTLLVVLHGSTGRAEGGGKVQLLDLADELGMVVCFPQGLKDPKGKTSWNVGYPSQEGMEVDDIDFMEVHGTGDTTSYWNGDYDNRYGWGAYLAVPAAVGYVVDANGCTGYRREDCTAGGKPVTRHRYYGGAPARGGQGHGTEVWLYEVTGGGHNWADGEFDVYAEIGRFIERFRY